MAEKIAQFRFKGYKILESSINISEGNDISKNFQVDFEQTSGVDLEQGKYKHTLITKIFNDNGTMDIKVKAIGMFEFEQEIPKEHLQNFFKKNAPAILFPYVRAYISALTSLSGIPSVILPTLNLSQR